MRRSIVLLLCGVLISAASVSAGLDDAHDKSDVLDTLETMARAYVKKDLKTLDAIYRDDMTYGHTTGEIQTKAEVLKEVGERTTDSFELSEPDIHLYGSVAVYRGIERIGIGGAKPNMSVRGVMWILMKGDGPRGWRIIARQNWPLPKR